MSDAAALQSNGEEGPATPPSDPSQTASRLWTDDLLNLLSSNPEALRSLLANAFPAQASVPVGTAVPAFSDRTPTFNVGQLTDTMTPSEIEDWIRGIEDGLATREGASTHQKILWAQQKTNETLRRSWRRYSEQLEDVTWELYASFIRQEHLNPEMADWNFRKAHWATRQQKDEDPMQFFTRWTQSARKVGDDYPVYANPALPVNATQLRRLSFDLFKRLHHDLQTYLEAQKDIWRTDAATQPRVMAQEAAIAWSKFYNKTTQRFESPFDKRSNAEPPRKKQKTGESTMQPGKGDRGGTQKPHQRRSSDKDAKSPARGRRRDSHSTNRRRNPPSAPRRDLSEVICYSCQKKGHYSGDCPEKTPASGVNATTAKVQNLSKSRVYDIADDAEESGNGRRQ